MKYILLNQMGDIAKLVEATNLIGLRPGMETLSIDEILIMRNPVIKTMGNPTNYQ